MYSLCLPIAPLRRGSPQGARALLTLKVADAPLNCASPGTFVVLTGRIPLLIGLSTRLPSPI